jgi:hypothetical protein
MGREKKKKQRRYHNKVVSTTELQPRVTYPIINTIDWLSNSHISILSTWKECVVLLLRLGRRSISTV